MRNETLWYQGQGVYIRSSASPLRNRDVFQDMAAHRDGSHEDKRGVQMPERDLSVNIDEENHVRMHAHGRLDAVFMGQKFMLNETHRLFPCVSRLSASPTPLVDAPVDDGEGVGPIANHR